MIIETRCHEAWMRAGNNGRVYLQAGSKDAEHPRFLVREQPDGSLEITAADGDLTITPISPNTIRIATPASPDQKGD